MVLNKYEIKFGFKVSNNKFDTKTVIVEAPTQGSAINLVLNGIWKEVFIISCKQTDKSAKADIRAMWA